MRVAAHWDTVQGAGSINEALKWLKNKAKSRCTGYLDFDKKGCVVKAHRGVGSSGPQPTTDGDSNR